MVKKKRIGLQIRFNPESEQDVEEFFSNLKKSEVHLAAISAFRMYMRSVGFYDKRWLENFSLPNLSKQQVTCKSINTKNKADFKTEGFVDKEAFMTFDTMFDNENELAD
jgi:hypothetical protein